MLARGVWHKQDIIKSTNFVLFNDVLSQLWQGIAIILKGFESKVTVEILLDSEPQVESLNLLKFA